MMPPDIKTIAWIVLLAAILFLDLFFHVWFHEYFYVCDKVFYVSYKIIK